MSQSKNDAAWEKLFNTHHIIEQVNNNGVYEISAVNINKQREARLMTKFDHHIQLPTLFKQNNFTIQPNSRGTYLIGRFVSYQPILDDESSDIEEVSFPTHIETINPENIYSESAALLCAFNAGIISRLLEEEVSLTVLGRMSTGRFSYFINDSQRGSPYEITVNNSQLEIDAGFEGQRGFALVEAKNESVQDFLVRQLYYPYRLWKSKTTKTVIPIFMSYSNDIFSFYVFLFEQEHNYNSIKLVNRKKYRIGSSEIELPNIVGVLAQTVIVPEPDDIPFPQADSFSRIVDLLTQLHGATMLSPDDITTNYAFDFRQTHYYTRAGMYLGLIERHQSRDQGVSYTLTPRGATIMAKRPQARSLALVECILEHEVFNQTLRLYLNQAGRPTPEQVVEIMNMAQLGLDKDGSTTIRRRAGTVLSWMDWIMALTRR
ncbi:MAG: hypothetical protein QOG71_1914 [Pyrinomonadaceae bacterium]|nr:hypothetical protein [Pyrinomonadaceae bacterium]